MTSLPQRPAEAWIIRVFFGLHAILVCLYLGTVLRSVVRRCSWKRITSSAVAVLGDCIHQCWRKKDMDEFEQKVRKLTERQRLEQGKSFFVHSLHPVAFASVALGIVNALNWYHNAHFFERPTYMQYQLQGGLTNLTAILGVCRCVRFFESSVGLRTLHIFVCLLLGAVCWRLMAVVDVSQLQTRASFSTVLRVALAVFVGTPLWTGGVNGMISLAICGKLLMLMQNMDPAEGEVGGAGPQHLILFQFMTFLETCVLSTIATAWTIEIERSKLQSRSSATTEAAIRSLQAVVCDAVVSINESLLLVGPNLSLANFLMRQPPSCSYENTSLLDFVVEDDRDRVQEQIKSSVTGPGATLSISTRLIDGNCALVRVLIYCVAYLDCNDRRGYCIGILEVKDPLGISSSGRADNTDAQSDDLAGRLVQEALCSVSEAAGNHEDADSVLSAVVVPLAGSPGTHQISFDLLDPRLSIRSMSASVTHLVGPLADGNNSFMDWFNDAEVAASVNRIAVAVDRYAATRDPALAVISMGRFRMQPTHAVRAGLQYLVDLEVDMTHSLDRRNEPGLPVLVRFSNVGMQKATRNSRLSSLPRLDGEATLSL
eukprot:TRINITY_DN19081_c0_g1_i1.p1 TRINITY_DN19081_c0_g1~~TRINITY_DN19081_c0_g1_i1.p1  ORF type:complete len:599 (-),score=49.89 TRINITY_DN19081_c0_g1_i1:256-2052(-)